jgi:molybdopterin-containing oxidoreductase family membrane subunit
MPKKFGPQGKLWVEFLLLVILIGAFAYYRQLRYGLVVTDMRDFTSWGIYISNFVFFVAISLVGSLVSAILKLTNYRLENTTGEDFRDHCRCSNNIRSTYYYR